MSIKLSPLGEKIFLDRYSMKNPTSALSAGDKVLYRDPITGQKEIGKVAHLVDGIHVYTNDAGDTLKFRREELDHPLETVEDTFRRVANAAANTPEETRDFFDIMQKGYFIPAGRILESLGSGNNTTSFNCFVCPSPKDSRDGIFKTLQEMAELMCKGGGVGINYSTLRPENAYVAGVNGRSSGAVSWLELFSYVTNLIIQGGSRRGAQMAMMADWHPDIFKFVTLKQEPGRATGCNMSVVVSDAFMRAVRDNSDWQLKFPDTSCPEYNEQWDGDIVAWQNQELPVVVWDTVKARKLWDTIITSAHASAEPGLWFVDVANANRTGGGKLVATNPCGEQGLPDYGVCNLGHLVLPAFVIDGVKMLDLDEIERATEIAVRFLDRVVDKANYPLPATYQRQQQERRIGLGTVGLGEALIRLGLRYGSTDAVSFVDALYERIARQAYRTSIEMARDCGPYPAWDLRRFNKSRFGQEIAANWFTTHEGITQYGLRNVCLLTQAPTGTVGTMLGTSTGIEPYYMLEWQRNSRLGKHIERASVVEEYYAEHGPEAKLPDHFVTAMDLDPHEHVAMQAAIQKWTDSSISKTINCPQHWTVEQIGEVYRALYSSGCKGGTVYRDRCRDVQVLESVKPEEKPIAFREPRKPYPSSRPSVTSSRETPGGTVHVHLTRDPQHGQPLEVFCDAGKSGSEVRALMEAMGRIMTLVLRVTDHEAPEERLAEMIGQLRGIGGSNSVGMGPKRVLSMPDGIALALTEASVFSGSSVGAPLDLEASGGLDVCPACQEVSLQRASGCETCVCGYSRC